MERFLSVTIPVKDFHLDHIFDCGQCFRWNRADDGSWTGIAGGRVARMRMEPAADPSGKISPAEGILTIEGIPLPGESEADFTTFWKGYLDLDRDYGKIKRSLGRGDAAMRRAIKAGAGIRILNQDLWETMVSFIISQNNNIPRIKGCIEAVCREFGRELEHVPKNIFDTVRQDSASEGNDLAAELDTVSGMSNCVESEKWYTIPGPEVLAELTRADLDGCKLGYRAPYLIETAKQVVRMGGMEAVEEQLKQAEDVIGALEDFAGVGPKVASCIALFGVGRYDAFPIDVWMKRAMHTVYGIEKVKEMERYAAEHFGRYGGFAQQYLFYYIRGL